MLPSTPVFGGMSTVGLLCLVAAFFFTAEISVVTGGTSLITVPVMLSLGVDSCGCALLGTITEFQ